MGSSSSCSCRADDAGITGDFVLDCAFVNTTAEAAAGVGETRTGLLTPDTIIVTDSSRWKTCVVPQHITTLWQLVTDAAPRWSTMPDDARDDVKARVYRQTDALVLAGRKSLARVYACPCVGVWFALRLLGVDPAL